VGSKVTTVDIENLNNPTSAVQQINANFQDLSDAFDRVLFKDGTAPNYLTADIDLNSNRLLNLPAPQTSNEPARWQDVQGAVTLTGYAIPSLSGNGGRVLKTDGSTIYWATGGIGDMLKSDNLSGLASTSAARTNLGLGTASTYSTGTSGATVPLLNGNNTFSGSVTFSGALSITNDVVFSGTGDLRLSNTPTTLHVDSVGWRGAPKNVQNNDYTFVLLDSGKQVYHTSATGHTYTIPASASVTFPDGTMIVVNNRGSGAITVAPAGGVTLTANGSGTSGNQTVSQYYVKTFLKHDTNSWTAL